MSSNRKVLLFGNGLGLALDPQYFLLETAIRHVWNQEDALDSASKQIITGCLPRSDYEYPHGEDDLDLLQSALSSCELLNWVEAGVSSSGIALLTEQGRHLPQAVKRFVYGVAAFFHSDQHTLPAGFVGPLMSFINATRSHAAVLNYDDLLYGPFVQEKILNGYQGTLVDGMVDAGFRPDRLDRWGGNDFGYYLHLHGSPLFYSREDVAYKLKRSHLKQSAEMLGNHVVLTHVRHKPRVISASYLLSEYWRRLQLALSESSELVVFGYSGQDEHLNQVIRDNAPPVPVRVVEWNGSGSMHARREFWKAQVGRAVELIQLANILEFSDWAQTSVASAQAA